MNESVKTKKALRGSLFALFLCIVLLIGTTFAWFTDSVSTGVNKIQAGNLDIEVSFAKEAKNADGTLAGELTEFKTIEDATDVFDNNALWEPGRIEYVVFKIENKGNLALKYRFNPAVFAQKAGVNVNNQEYELADYLCASAKVDEGPGVVGSGYGSTGIPSMDAYMAKRNDLGLTGYDKGATPAEKPLSGAVAEGSLDAGKINCVCMAVWMPETVGNEANAIDSDHAASIDLGINVVATQDTVENDSFDNEYDKDATYPTMIKNQESLNEAIKSASGKMANVELPKDTTVTLDNGIANEGSKSRNVTITGNGDTSVVDVITKSVSAEGGQLNYQRGSTFTFDNLKIQAGEGSFDGIVCDKLVFKNCTITGKLTLYGKATFVNCTFENTMANQYSIWTWGGTDVKFDKCTFNTNGKAILLYGTTNTNLTVNNCEFNDRNNGTAGKAAIEVGSGYNAKHNLTINNATVKGFTINPDGKNTGSKLWANKNSMDAAHLSVTIDGKKVQ